MGWLTAYVPSIFAAAVCTAMVMYAFTRRRDGTRRIIFAVGASIVVPVIVVVVAAHQSYNAADSIQVRLAIAIPVWLALVATTLIAGMGWMGLGKRVGDHPYCRKCGFDLFGKPEQSTRCSECGAELSQKRAVVIGVRVRGYKWLAASVFLFILGSLICGRPAYQLAMAVNWRLFEPMSMLVSELNGSNYVAAEREIARRFNEGRISVSQVRTLVNHLAAIQPGRRGWELASYPLIWISQHDDLDESETRRLIQLGAPSGWAFVPPKMSRGLPLPARIVSIADSDWRSTLLAGTTVRLHVLLCGLDFPLTNQLDETSSRYADPGPLWTKIPDGPTQITVQADAVIHFRSHGKEFTEPLTTKLYCPTFIATGVASEAPATRPTAADLAAVWTATFGKAQKDDDSLGLRIDSNGGQTRVVARVFLVDAAGRQEIGSFEGGPTYTTFHAGKNFRRPDGKAHLELVPAPEATRSSWDQSPFLDQTIRIDDVSVD